MPRRIDAVMKARRTPAAAYRRARVLAQTCSLCLGEPFISDQLYTRVLTAALIQP